MFWLDILNNCIQLNIQKLHEQMKGAESVYSADSVMWQAAMIYWVIVHAYYRALPVFVHEADLIYVMSLIQTKMGWTRTTTSRLHASTDSDVHIHVIYVVRTLKEFNKKGIYLITILTCVL